MATIADDRDLITKLDCEKNINKFTANMNELKDEINAFKIEIIREIAAIPDKLEGKFAPRWVADVMKLVIGGVGIALVGSVMALLLK